MASAFCGLLTHMVPVAIWSCPLFVGCRTRREMWAEGDTHGPEGWPQLLGGVCGSCYGCHEIWPRQATAAVRNEPNSTCSFV